MMDARQFRRLVKICLALAAFGSLICATGLAILYALVIRGLPEIYALGDYQPKLITRVLARDGREIGTFYRERRIVVPIEEMPDYLVHAFIAAEDDSFYEHEGLDWKGISRAALANLKAGGIAQGGSTITQQVAKTFLLSSERTWLRKLKDMVLARRIEKYFDKNEILYLYLNQIYLGSGAYGVEAAAQIYFGGSVGDLSLPQAALIAGLVPAPSRYTPRSNPEAAFNRQRFVLRRMAEEGFISEEDRQDALAEELVFASIDQSTLRSASAYFVEEIRRYLEETYGSEAMLTGGMTVLTTLDVEKQIYAYNAVRRGLRQHDRRTGSRGPIRSVPRMEWPALLEELARGEVDPPETGLELRPALVTEIDDELEIARLSLGPDQETTLGLEEVSWARPPNPEIDGLAVKLKHVRDALKPGYLVWLEKTGETLPEPTEHDTDDPEEGLAPIPRYTLYQAPRAEGALFSMQVGTGHIHAITGGYDFARSQFNRVVQSYRQPGSAFKPVIYAAALENDYTPATIVYDTPIVYEDKDSGALWKPGNYSDKFYGPITLRSSLAHSRNVATIKLLRAIGIPPVLRMAEAIGIKRSLEANLSLALGSSEVTLAELVRAYATFASGGRMIPPVFIREIRDRNGEILEEEVRLLRTEREARSDNEENEDSLRERLLEQIRASVDREDDPDALPPGYALDPITAYLMTDLLRAVVNEGTGWRAKALRRPVAGKTGTTNELFDAWFVGFTPDVVAGVWVGYDSARSLGKNETGSRAAAPIFVDYMRHALANYPKRDFPVPEGVVFARIDQKSGLLAPAIGDGAVFQPFRDGTVPEERAPSSGGRGSIKPTRLD